MVTIEAADRWGENMSVYLIADINSIFPNHLSQTDSLCLWSSVFAGWKIGHVEAQAALSEDIWADAMRSILG